MDDNYFSVEPYAPWGMFYVPVELEIKIGWEKLAPLMEKFFNKPRYSLPCVDEGPEVY